MDRAAQEVGQRIRARRLLRGLGLRVTAERAGISPAFLSMVERGQRRLDRHSHIAALAEVLQISPAELTGQAPARTHRASEAAHAAVPQVRGALTRVSPPPPADSRAVTPEFLRAEIDDAVRLVYRCDYVRVLQRIPGLLARLYEAVEKERSARRAEYVRLLLRAYHPVCVVPLRNLGYHDLAYLAVEYASVYVREIDEPSCHATHAYWRAWSSWFVGADDFITRTCATAADALARAARTPEDFSVYGSLCLRAAISSARRRSQHDALGYLREGIGVLGRAGGGVAGDLLFTPTKAGMDRAEVMCWLGRHDDVAHLARQVRVPTGSSPFERAHRHAVLGDALMYARGHEDEAVAHFLRAERTVPEHTHENPYVQRAVTELLTRSSGVTKGCELRGLAYRMGITPPDVPS
ncbi:helix-turn-helix domain-containing protein [Streptomyces halobius]|uniref:Helix-turn-helix domain-containing protein n=1 Tax=Streptomyces halobius TaxID=2879846 RepID=A0ABY4MHY2_9ACTN|nr:helix-turn-helix transcriptional regulator [Streptomyces halobius]UQA97415.1 helix-turn-helix domain-containing protein [Streptomyces halobius]